jgi:hypothetical protein
VATVGLTLAMIAPPLAIGATLALALAWLLREDDKPESDADTTPANPSPVPDAKRHRAGWTFFEDADPAAPVPGAMTETELQDRLRHNEAALVAARREVRDRKAKELALAARIADAKARRPAAISAPVERPAQASAPLQSRPRPSALAAVTDQAAAKATAAAPVAPVRPQVTTPAQTTPAASPKVTLAAAPSPAVIHPATPAPAVPVAARMPAKLAGFPFIALTVKREDLAAVFENGTKRLTRKDAVAALKARRVKQTTAYNALRDGGRFASLLDVGEDGLLGFKA